MRKPRLLALSATLLLASCAIFREPLPVSASCPPPPAAPRAVIEYAAPPTSLIEDSTTLLRELEINLRESLEQANKALTPQ